MYSVKVVSFKIPVQLPVGFKLQWNDCRRVDCLKGTTFDLK